MSDHSKPKTPFPAPEKKRRGRCWREILPKVNTWVGFWWPPQIPNVSDTVWGCGKLSLDYYIASFMHHRSVVKQKSGIEFFSDTQVSLRFRRALSYWVQILFLLWDFSVVPWCRQKLSQRKWETFFPKVCTWWPEIRAFAPSFWQAVDEINRGTPAKFMLLGMTLCLTF